MSKGGSIDHVHFFWEDGFGRFNFFFFFALLCMVRYIILLWCTQPLYILTVVAFIAHDVDSFVAGKCGGAIILYRGFHSLVCFGIFRICLGIRA